MSKYTNYEKVSHTYDTVRYASGVETMTNILAGILKKNPEEISMLEAGCGTGNYSLGFLQNGIGKLTMVDASKGMLERAREKVSSFGNKVQEIKEHKLPSIPYPDESFDVVTLIQVLHHLDTYHLTVDANKLSISGTELNGHDQPLNRSAKRIGSALDEDVHHINGADSAFNGHDYGDVDINVDDTEFNGEVHARTYKDKYPNLAHTIKEAYRVLKPQGVLLIDHSFDCNINCSWVALAPKALALWKEAFIHGGDLLQVINSENFKNTFCVTRPGSAVSTTAMYHNPELILDDKWRNCCSEWSFVNRTGELPAIIELVKKKKKEGKLGQFAYEQNKLFRLVGETTTMFARKF